MFLNSRKTGNQALGVSGNEQGLWNIAKIKKIRESYHQAGRIFKGVFNVASLISDFDLRLSFLGSKIKDSAEKLNAMFIGVASSSEEISTSITQIIGTNAELNTALNHVSKDAELLKENTEKSKEAFSQIKAENTEMIEISKDMEESVYDLLAVMEKINEAVKGINKISDQTKLLSLNAAIEAARAGAAGKGFAVVTDEIRMLSETTKKLTANIDSLLSEMNKASSKSKTSVTRTSQSIDRVSGSIESMSGVLVSNADAIENITDRIAGVATMSNSINESLQESSTALESVNADVQHLSGAVENLKEVSNSIGQISSSIAAIEDTVNTLADITGGMVHSKVCGLTNEDFIETVENAVKAHKSWMFNLTSMATEMRLIPIQTNEHKCGFGHFYYSVSPSSPQLKELWDSVEKIHHDLHKTGDLVIQSVSASDSVQAGQALKTAQQLSGTINQIFIRMIQLTKDMSLKGELVF